jgi:hypothetical protein
MAQRGSGSDDPLSSMFGRSISSTAATTTSTSSSGGGKVASPAKQMSESERRKMAAIGGDLFSGSRDRRAVTSTPLPSSPSPSLPSSSSSVSTPPPSLPTSSRATVSSASPSATPAVVSSLTAASTPTSSTSGDAHGHNSSSGNGDASVASMAPSRAVQIDVRQQSLESKLATDMEQARDRAVHLQSTWVTQRRVCAHACIPYTHTQPIPL